MEEISLGKLLIQKLECQNVEFIFGIPGVHTAELYRTLSQSKIRHITSRNEQGAGFMADGYARMSGKPGVCLVITGPGVTNIITAMAQARSDSIPMLVISGVNKLTNSTNQRAPLHSLPNQAKLVKTVAIATFTIRTIEQVEINHMRKEMSSYRNLTNSYLICLWILLLSAIKTLSLLANIKEEKTYK